MATASDTLPHDQSQQSRRALLGSLAAAPVALAAHTAAGALDPHVRWWQERQRLARELRAFDGRDDYDDDAHTALCHAKWAIEDRIADVPAATLAGLQVQVLVALEDLEEDMSPDDAEPQLQIRALRNMRGTLEQLAGRALA